jgi:hypothetical protein
VKVVGPLSPFFISFRSDSDTLVIRLACLANLDLKPQGTTVSDGKKTGTQDADVSSPVRPPRQPEVTGSTSSSGQALLDEKRLDAFLEALRSHPLPTRRSRSFTSPADPSSSRIGTDVEDANEGVIGGARESSEPEHVEEGEEAEKDEER